MGKVYALVDCNNFFASCERLLRPDLRQKPVAVLSNNDGCIIARSNEVKALGIRMGVPLYQIKKEVTQAGVEVFSANFMLYRHLSRRVAALLKEYSPAIEVYSIDESFLEISDLNITDYEAWGRALRERVWRWVGIPVSVGIGSTKTLAKIAIEHAKKHDPYRAYGVCSMVGIDNLRPFLEAIPVGDVWGIGWRTAPKMLAQGVKTAYDLSIRPKTWVQEQFNKIGQGTVLELQGTACFELEDPQYQKQLAMTRLFGHAVTSEAEVRAAVGFFAHEVARRLRRRKEVAQYLIVFVKSQKRYEGHKKLPSLYSAAQRVQLPYMTNDTGVLVKQALAACTELWRPEFAIKRAGVVLSGLLPEQHAQINLWHNEPHTEAQHRLHAELDRLHENGVQVRFGAELLGAKQWRSKHEHGSLYTFSAWDKLPIVKSA